MENKTANFTRMLRDYWEGFLYLLPNILIALLIFFVALWLAGRVKKLLSRKLKARSHDAILGEYLSVIAKWGVLIIGLLLILQALGLSGVAGGLLAGAGLSAFVVGFALKDIAENFLAGLILAFDRPFDVGDSISVEDITGKVMGLALRTTHIRTFDSKDIFVPNSTILTSPLTNLTHNGLIRLDFIVGIDYNDDIQKAIDLIEETALQVDGVMREDPPYATVDELDVSTLNLKVFFWAKTDDYKKGVVLLKGRIMQAVTKALLAQGFGLPASIQELKLYDYQKNIPVQVQQQQAEKEEGPAQ